MVTLEDLNRSAARNSVEYLNYPTIKIDQDEDSATAGHLYVEKRVRETVEEKGKQFERWVKKREQLGRTDAEVTLLRFRTKFEYFDQAGGSMIAQTNEIDDWQDTMYVQDSRGGIMVSGHYKTVVKPWMVENFAKGPGGHMFSMKRILYVDFLGEIYRLVISSASARGAGVDFDTAPDEKSYEGYMKKLYKQAKEHMVNYSTKINSAFKKIKIGGKSNSFYVFEFDLAEKHKPAEVPMESYNELASALTIDEKRRFHDKVGEAPVKMAKQPIMQPGAEVDFEDQPDVDESLSADNFHDKAGKPKRGAAKKAKDPWDNANDDL